MADYIFTIISRPVKTKDNSEFVRVFQELCFEESYASESDGTAWVGSYGEACWDDNSMIVVREKATGKVIGAYNSYCSSYSDLQEFLDDCVATVSDEEFNTLSAEEIEARQLKEEDYEEIDIETYIKDMLLDGQAFILTEAGNEKLRYNDGWGLVITKDETVSYDINILIDNYLLSKGLLGK